jgi:arabinose-5-phosphate isomerase
MKVSDLMHASPNIRPDAPWIDVVKTISKFALGAVSVVNGDGRLAGIITDGDLRRTIERSENDGLSGLTAREMMTADPITATPSMLAYDALQLMENRPSQISVLPVTDESGACVGLVRVHDLVRSGI